MIVDKVTPEQCWNNSLIEDKIINILEDYCFTEKDLQAMEREWEQGVPFDGGMSLSEAILQIIMNVNRY